MAQVALDLSMLGSKSTPRRRSSFSGYAVRRSSTTAFGETVTARRMSFDGDGIFGQLLGRKKLNPKKTRRIQVGRNLGNISIQSIQLLIKYTVI